MSRRQKRFETPADQAPVLDALRSCREAMLHVGRQVRIGGPVYLAADGVRSAIDVMAEAQMAN